MLWICVKKAMLMQNALPSKKVGGTLMSDGCQFTTNKPIINVILGVDGMLSLRLATDCSGQDKTISFICDLLYNVETRHAGVEARTCLCKKMHNVFMSRWSAFHAPIHSCFCNGQTILSEGDGSEGQEGYLDSDGGFFEGSWGPGFEQDEVTV